MRKYIALLMAALLAVFALAACGGGQQEEAAEEETQTEEEVGMANPWSDVDTAEEAAKGAGIDSFSIEEGTISLGGDEDYGLSADDLSTIINGLQ